MDPRNGGYGGAYRTEFFAEPHPQSRPPGTVGSNSVYFYGAPGADEASPPHNMHAPAHAHLAGHAGQPYDSGRCDDLSLGLSGLALGNSGPTYGPYEPQDHFPALSSAFSSSTDFGQSHSSSMWSHPHPTTATGGGGNSSSAPLPLPHQGHVLSLAQGRPAPHPAPAPVIPDASLFDVPTSSLSSGTVFAAAAAAAAAAASASTTAPAAPAATAAATGVGLTSSSSSSSLPASAQAVKTTPTTTTAPASASASSSSTLRADSARFVPRASAPAFVPQQRYVPAASAAGAGAAAAAAARGGGGGGGDDGDGEDDNGDGHDGHWDDEDDDDDDDGDGGGHHAHASSSANHTNDAARTYDVGDDEDEDEDDDPSLWMPPMEDPRTAAEAEALLNSLNARPGVAPPLPGGGTRFWTSSILPMMRRPDHPSAAAAVTSAATAASSTGAGPSRPVCSFYLQGTCRYGAGCANRHVLPDGGRACPLCAEEVAPGGEAAHAAVCPEAAAADRERAASASAECTICLDNITRKGQRFGLLSHCDHAFCLPCVREWRETSVGPGAYDKTMVRCCPQCRKISHFVIPSDRLVVDPVRKARLAEAYRTSLSQVPCKYFDPRNKADCPFGSSCFYAHKDAAGNDCKATVPRIKVDTEGQVTVVTAPKLSDFIDFDSMKTMKSKKKKKGGGNGNTGAGAGAGAAAVEAASEGKGAEGGKPVK